MRKMNWILGLAGGALLAGGAHAAFVIEVDTDGLDDGNLALSPNFAFGGDTTAASQSAASGAVGLTGGDSIFGGNGVEQPDTYLYTYTPGTDGDNTPLAEGTPLGGGSFASGIAAGGAATYRVFATWPFSENISGGPTTFTLSDGVNELFSAVIDQNGQGDEWVFLGQAELDPSLTFTLSQTAGSNTFVSMRSAGVMFDVVPEPASLALVGLGGLATLARRRSA